MKKGRGRLKDARKKAGRYSAGKLGTVFGRWVDLKENSWDPKRLRLFSPHNNLLAVFISSSFGKFLQGNAQRIPRLARRKQGKDGVF